MTTSTSGSDGACRFPLDKRLYDDFERGDRDTYSVPIDGAVADGMRVGDITRVQIEKSRDGVAGGWRLAGVRLRVNGRVIYSNRGVARWLEKGRRTWTALDFVPRAPRGTRIPVSLRLGEDDLLYGDDDAGDVNPYDRRRTVSIGYSPGPPLERETTGGGLLGGRLDDGGEASVRYRLETITPEPIRIAPPPPPTPTPPPPPPPPPDLVVTAFTLGSVTVANLGPGPAGPFRVRAGNAITRVFQSFAGLGPGATETRALSPPLTCTATHIAIVDDLEQVAETNEVNNVRDVEPADLLMPRHRARGISRGLRRVSQLRTGHLAALALAALALALSVGLALGAPADLDTSFDGDGRRTIGYGGADSGQAVALQPDGKILVAGYGGSSTAMTVTRLNPDGSNDNGFGAGGTRSVELSELGPEFAYAVAVQPDGKVVIVGETRMPAEAANVAVARLNPDGSPDLGFGGNGMRVIDLFGDDRGQAVALQPDGKILVAGFGGAFGTPR